jgi:hypothetical protein
MRRLWGGFFESIGWDGLGRDRGVGAISSLNFAKKIRDLC